MDAVALEAGLGHTRATLREWRRDDWRVIERWFWLSLATTLALLLSVYVVAGASPAHGASPVSTGLADRGSPADAADVLLRNGAVLALHALACVAGFIAGSELPRQARSRRGAWRTVHERAGPLAIAFVACATVFSLVSQALTLGGAAPGIASELGLSTEALLVAILPHALPELVALFLPLAAWLMASRAGDWHKLLAATCVTVGIALPVLVVAAAVETWVTPGLIDAIAA